MIETLNIVQAVVIFLVFFFQGRLIAKQQRTIRELQAKLISSEIKFRMTGLYKLWKDISEGRG